MAGVNKAILVGHLGKDPEVRNFESGANMVTFSMATTETYKDKNTGEKKEITEWHNIVLWRGLADIAAKYLHKGDLIYVEGRIRTRSWDKDNVKHYITEIHGDNMTMLRTQSSGQRPTPPPPSQESKPMQEEFKQPPGGTSDDLPF
jgi:single-strand DNA-binding protein